ncbi:MAG TPA: SRPBCC family protein [Hyphomicrobiaceae bacterium]|nr:SRPBCC family protein [Hyphomicrobiaceae bacterium]
MMRVLKFVGLALVIAIAGVLGYAATRPDHFQVSRSARINAPAEAIFPLINDLKAFNGWNPFAKHDPAMAITYNGTPSGPGAAYTWNGDSSVGAGSISIKQSTPPSRVVMALDMAKPLEAHNTVVFALNPGDGATEVSWTMSGESPFISKVLGLFCNVDTRVGGEFEKGLQSLKARAEGRASGSS